ncbi:hypothetical protein GCM10010399_80620 [Dactylosporangium fulvum]|uniref:PknH-like extracellular domain-containing protein n=1 Tax=Dactylosporangium fulvum TaxID=53359 RepID=A0ABY5WCW0_9ACTN|nr:hypothetical protein [Dactylosporangium fulvum]UWP87156.1 hypothetical protein Dfulv_24100 [Dactylosporangium fulvum]
MLRRSAAAALCLVMLTLAGCAPRYVRAEVLPSAAAPSATDLRPALLTQADLPAGFIQMTTVTDADGTVNIGGGDFPGCPALEPMTTEHTTAAATTFSKGVTGPYVTHAVIRFPAGEATAAMTTLAGTVESCRSFSQQLAGVTVRFDLTPTRPAATLGDQVVGLRMVGTTDFNLSVTAEIVAVRRGDLVLWLNDMAIGRDGSGVAGTLAPAAAERCAQRLEGC